MIDDAGRHFAPYYAYRIALALHAMLYLFRAGCRYCLRGYRILYSFSYVPHCLIASRDFAELMLSKKVLYASNIWQNTIFIL